MSQPSGAPAKEIRIIPSTKTRIATGTLDSDKTHTPMGEIVPAVPDRCIDPSSADSFKYGSGLYDDENDQSSTESCPPLPDVRPAPPDVSTTDDGRYTLESVVKRLDTLERKVDMILSLMQKQTGGQSLCAPSK
jgi:hypothetical protein